MPTAHTNPRYRWSTEGVHRANMPTIAAVIVVATQTWRFVAARKAGRMRMSRPFISILFILAGALLTAAGAAPDRSAARTCFASNDWKGWSAPGDGDFLYLRVGLNDIFRVDLTPGTHARKDADRFLVNKVRGSNWICSPLDLDLTLSDHNGFQEPLIARSLRKLTPAEVAAIPRKDLP